MIGADLRSGRYTVRLEAASFTFAHTARSSYRRLSPHKDGPSGLPAIMRSRRGLKQNRSQGGYFIRHLPFLREELSMLLTFDSASDLARALRRAADAHRQHEEHTGRPDADWPNWYALYSN